MVAEVCLTAFGGEAADRAAWAAAAPPEWLAELETAAAATAPLEAAGAETWQKHGIWFSDPELVSWFAKKVVDYKK